MLVFNENILCAIPDFSYGMPHYVDMYSIKYKEKFNLKKLKIFTIRNV